MSGHSKWSKVKHQKATTDAVKGMAFTKAAHAITVAVREGGGVIDPNFNFRLRLAIEKARGVNMPKENIERAIERGVGKAGGEIQALTYEGYGPGGVAVLVEVTTDNHQRSVAMIKNVFEHAGGGLAAPGAVSFLFGRAGVMTVAKANLTLDQLLTAALAAGADDVRERDDMFEVYSQAHNTAAVKQKLEEAGITIDNTELIMKPLTRVVLPEDKHRAAEKLIEELETLDDVQAVYSNLD